MIYYVLILIWIAAWPIAAYAFSWGIVKDCPEVYSDMDPDPAIIFSFVIVWPIGFLVVFLAPSFLRLFGRSFGWMIRAGAARARKARLKEGSLASPDGCAGAGKP